MDIHVSYAQPVTRGFPLQVHKMEVTIECIPDEITFLDEAMLNITLMLKNRFDPSWDKDDANPSDGMSWSPTPEKDANWNPEEGPEEDEKLPGEAPDWEYEED